MTKAWLAAGFETQRVDMVSRRLVLRRKDGSSASTGLPPAPRPAPAAAARSVGFLDRIRERLGGAVTIPEGVDVTAPTGEVWDAERV